MDEEIKILANKIVEKVDKKVRKVYLSEFHRFGTNIGIGADGTPTKYIDQLAEDIALDVVVYDNQMGEDEDADPATAIGGGSIVIHTKDDLEGTGEFFVRWNLSCPRLHAIW